MDARARKSFKDELAYYSAELTAARDDAVAPADKGKPAKRLTAHQQHLRDWMDHEVIARDIWARLKASSPDLDAQAFIRAVLKARTRALGIVKSLAIHKAERDRVLSRSAERAADCFSGRLSLTEIAERLECMADNLRDLDDWHTHTVPPDYPLPRRLQGSDQHRARRLFVQAVGRMVREHSGEWRDADVASLAEIAFPTLGEISEENVRAMRRAAGGELDRRFMN